MCQLQPLGEDVCRTSPQVGQWHRSVEQLAGGHAQAHLNCRTLTEPWGQTVARLLSDEGAIIGISYAPWMHTD